MSNSNCSVTIMDFIKLAYTNGIDLDIKHDSDKNVVITLHKGDIGMIHIFDSVELTNGNITGLDELLYSMVDTIEMIHAESLKEKNNAND